MIQLAISTLVIIGLIFFVIGLVAGVSLARPRPNINEQKKIEQAESRLEKQPEKTGPAWELARVTLEQYFNRNLEQVRRIFYISLGVMLLGFLLILFAMLFAIISGENSPLPASIVVIAGVITEMIGATFLFIYRSTMQQADNYTNTLERINSVGMAMQILDTMPNRAKEEYLKDKTKANVVEAIMINLFGQPSAKIITNMAVEDDT